MVPLVIVEAEIRLQAMGQCRHRRVVTDEDIFILDRAPQTFDEGVVEGLVRETPPFLQVRQYVRHLEQQIDDRVGGRVFDCSDVPTRIHRSSVR